MSKKVLCMGIIVGDFLAKPVEKMPEKGKLNLIERTELHIGGCAANTGIDLKKLGCDVAIVGRHNSHNTQNYSDIFIKIHYIKNENSKCWN